jgi:hypothetical protein
METGSVRKKIQKVVLAVLKHPMEAFMPPAHSQPWIVDVGGQRVFPVVPPEAEEVAIFIEYNGYRKQVNFPIKPAPAAEKKE